MHVHGALGLLAGKIFGRSLAPARGLDFWQVGMVIRGVTLSLKRKTSRAVI